MQAKILIVEDESITAMDIKRTLEILGFEILPIASEGEEAIKTAEKLKPDLILMDINLKGKISGIEAAEKIINLLDIPIIYLTAFSDKKTFERVKLTKPYGFLTKPINQEGLWASIITALYKHDIDKKLAENKKRYKLFFNNPLMGFALCEIITDNENNPIDFVYLDVNQAFEDFTGLKKDSVINIRVTNVFPPEDVKEIIKIYGKVALTGKSTTFEYPMPSLNKCYEIAAFSPQKNQFIAFFTDITERKKAEEKLRELQHNLEEKVEERTVEVEEAYHNLKEKKLSLKDTINELKRSNKELERFTYITSHDLQEPLRTITNYTQLLERRYKGRFDSDADEFMDFITDAAIRMSNMIQGLLEYSRVGTQKNEFKYFNAEDALKSALENLKVSIAECNAEITYDTLPVIHADEIQIIRVLQNLISNALKFRKDIFHPRAHISAIKDEDNKEWIFLVEDNGIGLEEQYTEQIFEVFRRLHTIDEYQGTGIGLAIVEKIISYHDGRIWVESQLGVGSTFYFTIPIK